jgi:Nucleotide-diphospho-sugar transferase
MDTSKAGDMKTSAFTICAYNYLSKALALAESFKKHNQNIEFTIFLVGRKMPIKNYAVNIQFIEDLNLKDYNHYAFKYDVIEFSTYLKPIILQILLRTFSKVYYIDPDIMLFSSLSVIDSELDKSNVVLTPHTFTSVDDGKKPSDLDFSRFGSFNLGFIGVRNTPTTVAFLNWWEAKLAEFGFYEPQSGMAVDQKWIDLAFVYFENFHIMRHIGCNVAFWNLHERKISVMDHKFWINQTTELIFVHFSSYNKSNTAIIADKQDRFVLGSRPDFQLVSEQYISLLQKNDSGLDATPYCYDYFVTGGRISNTLRRIYANYEKTFKASNVFSHESQIHHFAKAKGLISQGQVKRNNFKDINVFTRVQSVALFCLKVALKILGPDRYHMLMRYMAFMSSILNQSKMFKVVKK